MSLKLFSFEIVSLSFHVVLVGGGRLPRSKGRGDLDQFNFCYRNKYLDSTSVCTSLFDWSLIVLPTSRALLYFL